MVVSESSTNYVFGDSVHCTCDAANRLVDYNNGTATFGYNGDGDRIWQEYDGQRTDYLLGLDIIGQQQESAWSYFGYDGLGSVRQVFDALGAVGYTTSYAPYGDPFEQYGDLTTSLGFTGEYTDASGLLFLRARYLNTDLGTFLTKDPFEGVMDRSITRNAYIYAGANPVMYVDPSGQFFIPIIPLLIAIPILVAVISAAYDILVRQGVGGIDNPNRAKCIDWQSAVSAGLAGALGAVEAEVGIVLGPLYAVGWAMNVVKPYSGFTPRQFNAYILSWFGLDDEYERLVENLYFNAGSTAGGVATLVMSVGTYARILDKLQRGGGIANFTTKLGNGTLTLQLQSVGVGEMTVIVTGAYGATTLGQVVLMASNGGGPRRSDHSEQRRAEGRRTGPAFNDAQKATKDRLFFDNDTGRYVLRAGKGREHIFEPNGELLTTIDRSNNAHLARVASGRIRSVTAEEFLYFKEIFQ